MIGIEKKLVDLVLKKIPDRFKAETNIQEFYSEYFKQDIIINEKLKICVNSENRKRINDFRDEVDYLKSLFDEILCNMDNKNFKNVKLMYKIGKFSIKMNSKYKKENCDIDNFKV